MEKLASKALEMVVLVMIRFLSKRYSHSMASMNQEIKNNVSHRAIATKKFVDIFNSTVV